MTCAPASALPCLDYSLVHCKGWHLEEKTEISWKCILYILEEGHPTPMLSALLRRWPVLLRADFILTKDPVVASLQDPSVSGFYTTKLPFVRRFWVLGVRTKSTLSKTGRFLSKAANMGMEVFFPLPNIGLRPQDILRPSKCCRRWLVPAASRESQGAMTAWNRGLPSFPSDLNMDL